MAKSAVITLTSAGTNTGPFNLLSDVDSFVTPFETGISKSSLVAGYTTNLIPDAAQIIKVKSNGSCTNDIELVYPGFTTTTSTTSTTTTEETTTTTTTTSTTTTTTTTLCCYQYEITNYYTTAKTVYYSDCSGVSTSVSATGNGFQTYITARQGSVHHNETECSSTSVDCIAIVQSNNPVGGECYDNLYLTYANDAQSNQSWSIIYSYVGDNGLITVTADNPNQTVEGSTFVLGPVGVTSNSSLVNIQVKKNTNSGITGNLTGFDLYVDSSNGWVAPTWGLPVHPGFDVSTFGTTNFSSYQTINGAGAAIGFGNYTFNPGDRIKVVITDGL